MKDNKASWLAALLAAVDARSPTYFATFLTEDVEFKFGNLDAVIGRDAAANYVADFFSSIAGLTHEVERVIFEETLVVCHGSVTYTLLDQSCLTLPFSNWLYLQDDKIERYLVFVDNSALYC